MKVALAVVWMAALAATPQFEVASIKPANAIESPGRMGGHINTSPGLLSTRSASLKELIAAAYALESYQVSGKAEWLDTARFAVEAKPAAAASREQLLLMLRTLLAERFQLVVHGETKTSPSMLWWSRRTVRSSRDRTLALSRRLANQNTSAAMKS
jgi:hypothetical protein